MNKGQDAVLIDSSFNYALFNSGDRKHQQAKTFAAGSLLVAYVPDIILVEAAYLIERDFGHYAISGFLKAFLSTQPNLQSITLSDLIRAHEIMSDYEKAKFDLVDCCIMALAERLNITKICTFDRRDFSVFRPAHCDYLELLP